MSGGTREIRAPPRTSDAHLSVWDHVALQSSGRFGTSQGLVKFSRTCRFWTCAVLGASKLEVFMAFHTAKPSIGSKV